MVEHGQQLRQRRRLATPVHAEAPLPRRRVDLVAERRRQLGVAVEELGDAPDVADRPLGRDRGAVGRRRVVTDPLEQLAPVLVAVLGDEGGAHAVGPRRRELVDGALERVDVDGRGPRRRGAR